MLKNQNLFFIYLLPFVVFSQHTIPSYNYSNCNFQAIGHRGYSDNYPENTLLSIEEAFKRGVKYCEIDVNVTSDDIYVLFHDQPTMYRTSSGQGYVVGSKYEDLLKLDLGSWKGSQFEGTKIATLEEALILAEKYDGYYYLDTKKFRPDLMGKALKTTGVNPKRLMAAIANKEEALEYKKYCPNSPWIYFGLLPDDINDDNWYKDLVDLGCEIFEVYYTMALKNDEKFQTFVNKVHQHGAKVWVFTSNNLDEIKKIKAAKVDGVESDIAISAMKAICDQEKIEIAPRNRTTTNFNFSQESLYSTGIGSQLRPLNYSDIDKQQKLSYGKTSHFKIKPINGIDTHVMKVPAFNPQNGLFMFTNFTPGIHEDLHYDFSLIIDLYIPIKSENKFISLIQTNPENENDGDLFITSKGIGINNNYHGKITVENWYRIAIVFSEKSIKKYINGKFVGETFIEGGRWSVYNTFSGGQNQGFLLFADDDNETAELYVKALQLRNYPMNATEIARLAGANANGIPISNTGIYMVKFDEELKPTIVNWDNKEVYVTFSKEANVSKIKINFNLPYGASSIIKPGDLIDFTKHSQKSILVTAEDLYTTTEWKIIPLFE